MSLRLRTARPTVTDGQLKADCDGVLELKATSGQQVYKGQVLALLHDLTAIEVTAQVDEVDLDRVHVGDSLKVICDRYPDTELSGTVVSISGMGVQKQKRLLLQRKALPFHQSGASSRHERHRLPSLRGSAP